MSSSADIAAHPVVTALRAVADALVELPLWQLSAADEANVLADVEIERRRVEYGWLRVLADFDRRGVSIEQAGLPTRAFLGLRLRLSPSDAASRLRIAAELAESTAPSGEPIPPALPATAAVAATGDISPEHIRVIDRAVHKLPVDIAPEVRAEAEAALAEHARELDPSALTIVARRIHMTQYRHPNQPTPGRRPAAAPTASSNYAAATSTPGNSRPRVGKSPTSPSPWASMTGPPR